MHVDKFGVNVRGEFLTPTIYRFNVWFGALPILGTAQEQEACCAHQPRGGEHLGQIPKIFDIVVQTYAPVAKLVEEGGNGEPG